VPLMTFSLMIGPASRIGAGGIFKDYLERQISGG
jgi:hypothetical protein